MRVLITGAAGFIGSHVVDHLLKKTDWQLSLLLRMGKAGSLNRLRDSAIVLDRIGRITTFFHDLRSPISPLLARQLGEFDYVLHFGASTHVDRSIEDPRSFVEDNVLGTCNLLEWSRTLVGLKALVYFSTDEVFGPATDGYNFKEWDRYNSRNPYAATKAGAEELCLAYYNTYRLPIIITHCMNVFGERQHPEKFIPTCIRSILDHVLIQIHADADKRRPGSRFYLHARNVASAMLHILAHGQVGEKYNIVGEQEVDNLELALFISRVLGIAVNYRLIDFHSSRPGHDLRYALDGTKLATLGWKPPIGFEGSLERVIKWSAENKEWLYA